MSIYDIIPSRRLSAIVESIGLTVTHPDKPESIPLPALYDFFLNPLTPLVFGVAYFIIAKTLSHKQNGVNRIQGPIWNAILVLHNVILAVYSGWTFINVTPTVLTAFYKGFMADGFVGLTHVYCDSDVAMWHSTQFPRFCYIFYLSKYYEVLDTVIILAKGKKVGMLQSYHHTGAIWTMYAGYSTMSMPMWIFCVFNSGIHTLMYSYYTFTTMKLPFPSFLKRQLTTLQITQFLIGGSLAASYLFIQLPTFEASSLVEALSVGELTQASVVRMGTQCVVATGQRLAVWLNVVYLIPLTYLFAAFFFKSYSRPAKTSKKTQ